MGQCDSCAAYDDDERITVVRWEEHACRLSEKEKDQIQKTVLTDDLVAEILDDKIYMTIEAFRHCISSRLSAETGVNELLSQPWFRRTLAEKAYVRGIACPEFANSVDWDAPIASTCRNYVCRNPATWFKLRKVIGDEAKMGRELYLCSRRMDVRNAEMAKWDRRHRKFEALKSAFDSEAIGLVIASFDSEFKEIVEVYNEMSCIGGSLSGGRKFPSQIEIDKKSSLDYAAYKTSSASSTSYLMQTAAW